ncbi:hypothetical protein GOPIP_063_00120 [Gordonia polyisoprenivorans NBRC 16320 = JCM 10675]|uniref:Polysaccharide biosynthesis protein n=1 Tax=Gordonia polyisoprenivorans TaxID=84595 RepID=A0A846WFR7_9ACTN|nr:hypothetical protein [Gordonia polyisoprenivorans]NKY00464.1 hypothetical protein [Gordonia polyisoprenivorans]GAB24098.1 hypothetical protein GOPIP_063_00120 [Gordonia polyisoprenivorans NBRC 16320 = JCM 10675]
MNDTERVEPTSSGRSGELWGRWKSLVSRIAAQPLLITQMLYSAAGALPVLFAAAAMTPAHFTRFSFLILLVQVVSGAVVTCIFRAAMLHYRTNRTAHIRLRITVSVTVICCAVFAGGAFAFDVHDWRPLLVVSLASGIPIFTEWLRHRAMTLDHRWEVVRADGLRLVVTMLISLSLFISDNPEVYYTLYCLAWFPSIVLLAVRVARPEVFCPMSRYRHLVAHLLVDFVVGQFMVILPLMVLGGLGNSTYLGGIRLAQTLLGPLNTVFAALTTNLFVDGVTSKSAMANDQVIRSGRRLATQLAVISAVFVPAVLVVIWVTGLSLRGVGNTELLVGIALVGILAILYNTSAVDAVVLRIVGHNRVATVGRTVLAISSVAGFTIGYLVAGVDGSLVIGFLASAIANPLCFVVPATFVYRSIRAEATPDPIPTAADDGVR